MLRESFCQSQTPVPSHVRSKTFAKWHPAVTCHNGQRRFRGALVYIVIRTVRVLEGVGTIQNMYRISRKISATVRLTKPTNQNLRSVGRKPYLMRSNKALAWSARVRLQPYVPVHGGERLVVQHATQDDLPAGESRVLSAQMDTTKTLIYDHLLLSPVFRITSNNPLSAHPGHYNDPGLRSSINYACDTECDLSSHLNESHGR